LKELINKEMIAVILISVLFANTEIDIIEDIQHDIYESEKLTKYFAYNSNINLTISLFQKEQTKKEVKGVQFDIIYNPKELILNELTSLVDGATFEYVPVEEGRTRCVIFNLNGKSFSMSELSNLIIMSFSQKPNWYNSSDIRLKDLIVVGEFGEDISYSYMISSYQVDFSELIPKSSYIHELDSYVFKDSIKVAFQLHNQSSNVNLSLYNIFDLTEKTIINGYRGMGVYDFYLNIYNDFQEELDEGKFKLKLIVDQSPIDSIYVVYDKNKN